MKVAKHISLIATNRLNFHRTISIAIINSK